MEKKIETMAGLQKGGREAENDDKKKRNKRKQ